MPVIAGETRGNGRKNTYLLSELRPSEVRPKEVRPFEVHLPDRYTAVSTGQVGEVHRIADMDGEILLR
ncbi:MAG: hypothetical protein QF777_11730 [Acidimicrobiales bacterium]|jgi:hypothetical protein|nr:hypothetical protein [Acidimicrobiales bacterium]MDP6912212.1 hypothetical protein [Acidimicrobiales bacterium]